MSHFRFLEHQNLRSNLQKSFRFWGPSSIPHSGAQGPSPNRGSASTWRLPSRVPVVQILNTPLYNRPTIQFCADSDSQPTVDPNPNHSLRHWSLWSVEYLSTLNQNHWCSIRFRY